MKMMHLHLIEPRTVPDTRLAEIHEAFLSVWGDDADPLEVQHRDALINLGVTPEAARREFSLRKLRQLRGE
jgi:hypothetical protein